MGNYNRQLKKILTSNGCRFVRHGKGDHDVWYSPITGRNFAMDGKIVKRTSANELLKEAGLKIKV